jgi:hypothetical protein
MDYFPVVNICLRSNGCNLYRYNGVLAELAPVLPLPRRRQR